jgi:hypothetical protein
MKDRFHPICMDKIKDEGRKMKDEGQSDSFPNPEGLAELQIVKR